MEAMEVMQNLQKLEVSNAYISSLGFLTGKSRLKWLRLFRASGLSNLEGLPATISLAEFDDCASLADIRALGDLPMLKCVVINACPNVKDLPKFKYATNARSITLLSTGVEDISEVGEMSDLRLLRVVGRRGSQKWLKSVKPEKAFPSRYQLVRYSRRRD